MPHNLQGARFQIKMANFATADDLLGAWDGLRMSTHTGLPPELRAHQRDALLWLHRDKHVLLCVGTGFWKLYRFCPYLILLSEFPNPLYPGSGKTLVQLTNALLSETCE